MTAAAEAVEDLVVRALFAVVRTEHRPTDPRCRRYVGHSTRLGRWWHDVNRGRVCQPCSAARTTAAELKAAGAAIDRGRRLHLIPGDLDPTERCVRTLDRLTCSTHGEAWPCPRQDDELVDGVHGDGGPCPLDCGRYVARVLLEGHLELHRRRGDLGGGQ